MFLIYYVIPIFFKILFTVSSFLHVMKTKTVIFCKNELRFMPKTISFLNPMLLLLMNFFSFVKNKSRVSLYL